MKTKIRLDLLLVERELAPTRERAQAYIMSGKVLVNETKIMKSGTKFEDAVEIRVIGVDHAYVGRGGLKLEKALTEFQIKTDNIIAMDVGASTGGFTDCLLQRGASFVFAVDVGTGQLDWKLISNHQVKNIEKTNFRSMEMAVIGTFVNLIVIDVSFISITRMLDNCPTFLAEGGQVICLIKPQFEAGKEAIDKGGIVRDPKVRQQTIKKVTDHALALGFEVSPVIESPIQGKKSGNQEYLVCLKKTASSGQGEKS